MSREAAAREVRRAVAQSGLNQKQFADKANVDEGTLGDFLEGRRWPQMTTRTKIEKALAWPAGRITDLAEGHATVIGLSSNYDAVVKAILADPNLLPEAKAHLVNQYGLLLRIQGTDTLAPAAAEAVEEQHKNLALIADQLRADEVKKSSPSGRPSQGGRKRR